MSKQDQYDDADYYDCDDAGEELTHGCPEEAIEWQLSNTADAGDTWEQMIERCAPVTVYAWKRREIDPKWLEREAERFVEDLQCEWVDEAYGNPDGGSDRIFNKALIAKLTGVLREHIKPEDVWHCKPCGEREYSADELRAMFAGELAAEDGACKA